MAAVAERGAVATEGLQEAEQGMEDLAMGPIPIQQLTSKGISAGDIKKLIEGGVHTVECLAHLSKKELCQIKGISENKVEKLQQVAWTIVPMGFTTATVIAENQAEKIMIHTGCKEVSEPSGQPLFLPRLVAESSFLSFPWLTSRRRWTPFWREAWRPGASLRSTASTDAARPSFVTPCA